MGCFMYSSAFMSGGLTGESGEERDLQFQFGAEVPLKALDPYAILEVVLH